MNYNLVNFCEFDKYATKSYCAIHGVDEGLNLGDITQVDIDSLPSEGVDLITHGSPCFTAETLVLTNKGYKKIIDIEVGDMVLDHTLNYNKVINTFEQGKKEIWKLELCDNIRHRPVISVRTTNNHKFYTWNKETGTIDWVECKDLNSSYLVATVDRNKQIAWREIFLIANTCYYEEVYDIEVENTHSFIANGIIAHNCQSFSIAGKQHGGEKDSGTRSSLLWNSVEIIRHCKPKFVIWENVKNVLSAKHKPVFDAYVDEMKNIGYNTYYRVLNAKNYGIPQNRERIYAISVREDIDNNQNYTGNITHNKYYDRNDKSLFPEPFDNGLRLKDFLEAEVDERYYLKGIKDFFIKNSFQQEANGNGFRFSPHVKNNATLAKTVTTRSRSRMDDNYVIDIEAQSDKVKFDTTDNTLKQICYINTGGQANRVFDSNYLARTLMANGGGGGAKTGLYTSNEDFRIRKLTPRECYRLMGFSDEDFDKAAFEKEIIKIEGGDNICNAKLKVVTDKHKQNDMETYASNTINNIQNMEILSTKMKKLANELKNEEMQNVNIVIEKLEESERLECVTSTIRCGDYMGMHYTLITEKDPLRMAIIVQVKRGLGNIEKYMKITTESNLLQNKLFTILTLFAQIIELKIFTSTTVSLNIRGFMQSIEDCEKNTLIKLSNLEMERTTSRNSNTALYKQAGNSIVVNVLTEIYKCLQAAYPNDFTKGMNVISLFSGIGAFEKALERL